MRTVVAVVGLVVLFVAAPADARLMYRWSYAELTEKADLIVLATPGATTDTGQRDQLPGISESDGHGGPAHPVFAIRVASKLEIVATLKGSATPEIVLHHYRKAGTDLGRGEPGLVSFDPDAKKLYLMFLRRDGDGEYVAVSGQTDPDQSIKPFDSRSW